MRFSLRPGRGRKPHAPRQRWQRGPQFAGKDLRGALEEFEYFFVNPGGYDRNDREIVRDLEGCWKHVGSVLHAASRASETVVLADSSGSRVFLSGILHDLFGSLFGPFEPGHYGKNRRSVNDNARGSCV